MHKIKFILFTLVAGYLTGCSAESTPRAGEHSSLVEGVWYSMEDAQQKAEDESKKVVIFVYTDWCGFCRRMDREVHANEDVIDSYKKYFYPVRLNAESDKTIVFNGEEYTESELAMAFGVTSYPSTIFIGEDGEPFGAQPGFIEKDLFRNILNFVGSGAYEHQSFQSFQNR